MRIALIGAHPTSRLGAPFKDNDWTIWACSERNMGVLPRADTWFELHDPPGSDKYVQRWLRLQPSLIVRTQQVQQILPHASLYPEADMRERFGPFFFTSSVAYMLALAVSKLPEEIALWGVGMHTGQEYEYQRPGCHYFVQRARDAGIKVTVPRNSTLLEPPEEKW